ncbi:MAG: TlpA family protein disulfide reductase [Bacteroidales bacterium]|nr:TlpA family protein disulfide reductase [Bacteroidales bacterium]
MDLKKFLTVLVAVSCCLLAAGQNNTGLKEGDKYIDFEVVQPDGNPVKLSDYVGKGKYILVDFWASWCGPCREEIPHLKDIWYEFKGDKFDIVGAPVYDKVKNTLEAVDEFKIPWKQILEVPESVPEAYGFDYIPYIILIGPDGTILERDLRGEAVREAVKKYLITK